MGKGTRKGSDKKKINENRGWISDHRPNPNRDIYSKFVQSTTLGRYLNSSHSYMSFHVSRYSIYLDRPINPSKYFFFEREREREKSKSIASYDRVGGSTCKFEMGRRRERGSMVGNDKCERAAITDNFDENIEGPLNRALIRNTEYPSVFVVIWCARVRFSKCVYLCVYVYIFTRERES